MLAFCIETMTICSKSTVLLSLKPSDIGVGHLVVLSQYQWPKYVPLLMQCINAIQLPLSSIAPGRASAQAAAHKFCYPTFFDHVFNPDILEEFMSLSSDERLVLELNVPAGPSLKPPTKSMTTRGVNKGAKDEVRGALITQMKVSKYSLDNSAFVQFILNEMRPSMAAYFS